MHILTCIKRVPVPGVKIVLTEDEQAINTKNLGFTISPHEECAVEQAIRMAKDHDGSTTVMTLGKEESVEQLRGAMAMGIQNGVLIEADEHDWDPVATANAIVETVRAMEKEGTHFDMLFFGNESADSGNYQVGIRVAYALDLPCVTGIKSLEVKDGVATAIRESGNVREVFEVPLPAVFTIKEGINAPRYPTMPGRLKAKRATIPHYQVQWQEESLKKVRLKTVDDSGKTVQILGDGASASGAVIDILKDLRFIDS